MSTGSVVLPANQGLPVGLSSLLLQLQVIFTIAIAALVLGERPRREQIAGAAIAFAGLAVVGIDRAASAPILPFVLVVGAAAAWGVSNTLTRVAQPPDALALLVWASLVAPLPLLGSRSRPRGRRRSATRSPGSTSPRSRRCCSSRASAACSASRPGSRCSSATAPR
jgi:O-acetylserine/cysteine efflux transporter